MQYTKRRTQLLRYPINGFFEGLQEQIYFERLRDIVNNCPDKKRIIDLKSDNCGGSAPDVVVNKAIRKSLKTQPSTASFDFDFKQKSFEKAIDLCIKHKIIMAYSNINFDLWLVLHKITKPSTTQHNNNAAYIPQLRKVYGLPQNANVKEEKIIRKIIEQIELDDIKQAINNCKQIDVFNTSNKICKKTSNSNSYYDNPDFSIHTVVEDILKQTLINFTT